MKHLRPPALAALLLTLCSAACATEQAAEQPASDRAKPERDCFAVGNTQAREACFAGMDAEALAECARLRPLACLPYKKMHDAEARIGSLGAEIASRSKAKFASYIVNDKAYLSDLADTLKADADAWAHSRDTKCQLEPFIQGMSRSEAGDLTEACRLDASLERISELEGILSNLKD